MKDAALIQSAAVAIPFANGEISSCNIKFLVDPARDQIAIQCRGQMLPQQLCRSKFVNP
jgi:hypothetical protein